MYRTEMGLNKRPTAWWIWLPPWGPNRLDKNKFAWRNPVVRGSVLWIEVDVKRIEYSLFILKVGTSFFCFPIKQFWDSWDLITQWYWYLSSSRDGLKSMATLMFITEVSIHYICLSFLWISIYFLINYFKINIHHISPYHAHSLCCGHVLGTR